VSAPKRTRRALVTAADVRVRAIVDAARLAHDACGGGARASVTVYNASDEILDAASRLAEARDRIAEHGGKRWRIVTAWNHRVDFHGEDLPDVAASPVEEQAS
jgi:hypothetical protein